MHHIHLDLLRGSVCHFDLKAFLLICQMIALAYTRELWIMQRVQGFGQERRDSGHAVIAIVVIRSLISFEARTTHSHKLLPILQSNFLAFQNSDSAKMIAQKDAGEGMRTWNQLLG